MMITIVTIKINDNIDIIRYMSVQNLLSAF